MVTHHTLAQPPGSLPRPATLPSFYPQNPPYAVTPQQQQQPLSPSTHHTPPPPQLNYDPRASHISPAPQHTYSYPGEQQPYIPMEKPTGQQPLPQTQQPQATQAMTVAPGGGSRNPKNVPVDADGTRDWSHGFCDCCEDAGTCILATFCPCVIYAQVKQRIEYLDAHNLPDPEAGGDFCSGPCWIHACMNEFCGAGRILQIFTRGTVRARYGIKGDGCGDCLAACCCTPCELTQESREIDLEEQALVPLPKIDAN